MSNKVEIIRTWANIAYEESYGAQCIVECMSDDEIDTTFKDLNDAAEWAKLQNERYNEVASEAF